MSTSSRTTGATSRFERRTTELLRAAEELGIDLSPAAVRAAAGELSAQEVEEGAAAIDEGGDVAVAADEALDGVEADAELEVGLADIELDD